MGVIGLILWLFDSIERRTGTEKRRTHADFRGAFLDGRFEVVGHTHGQYRQFPAYPQLQLIAQLSQPGKIRTDFLDILEEWRNAHEPTKVEMLERFDFLRKRWQLRLGHAAFPGFSADLNFKKHTEGPVDRESVSRTIELQR